MPRKNLSLTSATLLCFNTMLGAGLSLNLKPLALFLGPLAPLAYIVTALFMIPLILSISELAHLHPVSGGLYVYSKIYLGEFIGFLSGWTYFLGKVAASVFLIHMVDSYFYSNSPAIQNTMSLFAMDSLLIFFLTALHMTGNTIGTHIQYFFTVIKMIPLIFGITAGFLSFDSNVLFAIPTGIGSLATINTIIPICLFTLIGFEVICSIGGFVENPSKNIRQAIFSAFGGVCIAACLFQFFMYGSLGQSMCSASAPMLAVGLKVVGSQTWIATLATWLVFAAISGGAFFILGSNCWNLHAMAKDQNFPWSPYITATNRAHAPWVALLIQALLALVMLGITSQQMHLEKIAIFAIFFAFFLTCLATIRASRQNFFCINKWIPFVAMVICAYVLGVCFQALISEKVLLPFFGIFALGAISAIVQKMKSQDPQ